ncbi:hypothetical protein C0991_001522 [Blastosporella zonata]|nr:hypothetical protein C0991_001522 [Blastosporella zonata]
MRWIALLAIGVVACMADDEMPCTIHHKGQYYDLNPLKSNRDYEFRTLEDNLFAVNVCRRPLKETFGLKDVDEAKIGGFVRRAHGDFSIGAVNTTLSMYDSNPRMTLTGGSRCTLKSGQTELRASTIVDFVCDKTVFGTGEPRLVAQFPPGSDEEACGYFIEWKTHIACPTNEPGGAWGFLAFLIFFLIALALLYLVAGTLYNRFILGLRGIDQIPRFSIESMRYHASEAVDWVKDLTGIASNQYNYRMPEEGLSSSAGSAFPRSAQATGGINPVSHQTQVLSPAPAEGTRGAGSGGFVRPYHSRTTSATGAPGKRPEINPVSHQAQTSAPLASSPPFSDAAQSQQQLQARSPPPPPASTPIPAPAPVKKEKPRPQPFDLGDDEEDDVAMGSAASAGVSSPQVSTAAQERGRDLGDGQGVVRL